MAKVDPVTVIILLELVAFLVIALLAVVSYFLVKKRKISKMLSEVLQQVSEKRQERKSYLIQTFGKCETITKDNLEKISESIVEAEQSFFEDFINTVFLKDLKMIREITTATGKLSMPYEGLASAIEKRDTSRDDEKPISTDVGEAIDEILANDSGEQANPDLDLSSDNEISGIAEIPDDLLAEADSFPDISESKNQ